MDPRRVARIAWIVVSLWLIIFFIFFIALPAIKERESFLQSEYFGRILEIEKRPDHRGNLHIFLNGHWKLLNMSEMKIAAYIEPGDSLVKTQGSQIIVIYRTSDEGKVLRKEFK